MGRSAPFPLRSSSLSNTLGSIPSGSSVPESSATPPLMTTKMSTTLRQHGSSTGVGRPSRVKFHQSGNLPSHQVEPMRDVSSTSAVRGLSTTSWSGASPAPAIPSTPPPPISTRTKTKIKPLFRKRAPEINTLDLGRSATEDDGLAVYSTSVRAGTRSIMDPATGLPGRKSFSHHRSTSGTSQFSTATTGSASRPYAHPMRQTPRPFTPPIAHSFSNSFLGSEQSASATDLGVLEDDPSRRGPGDVATWGVPAHVLPHVTSPPSLRLDTNPSLTQLALESQSILGGTPSSMPPRAGAMSPAGTVSPISRSSSDFHFRPRHFDAVDPASRAASIRAAREAFEEREAAKAERAERQERRQLQKRLKREEELRAKGERRERKQFNNAGGPSRTGSSGMEEKHQGLAAAAAAGARPSHSAGAGQDENRTKRRADLSPPSVDADPPSTSTLRKRWLLFITWLRTRFYKLGRKMRRNGS
ncbi:MAG: hypothetical protein M1823_003900 [Watsoniomyces obsoletus]|nr:MAG: hypothetical protein M1823_003900 [Watsoniomyces obsoletus]